MLTKTEIITSFYAAFNRLDSAEMNRHYHHNVVFTDPAFGTLRGTQVGLMWEMLCKSQKADSFSVALLEITEAGKDVKATWQAKYIFSKTGRKVCNTVKASFQFEGEKIIVHQDDFDIHLWARQALGLSGLLLGWSAFFKRKLQQQTHKMLENYSRKKQAIKP